MLELFRLETENQAAVLTSGLLELENGPATPAVFEGLMRAAHSLKGAARIVNLPGAVGLAHALEDCFVAAQQGKSRLQHREIDLLLRIVDWLVHLAKQPETTIAAWENEHLPEINAFLAAAARISPSSINLPGSGPSMDQDPLTVTPPPTLSPPAPAPASALISAAHGETAERVLRLTAENLNRLLGLAGESLVESRWLRPFADSLQQLKRRHTELSERLEQLRLGLQDAPVSERSREQLRELSVQLTGAQQFLGDRIHELDVFDRRAAQLSQRLYLEVLRTRMRPFSDGVRRFPRMVRDLARSLDKAVKLEVYGETTQVDRDILERLETPLAHLLRNAVDHGCETPATRQANGKPAEFTIRLEAHHSAGMLVVTVADDGVGVNLEEVRRAVVQKQLATPAAARRLSEAELLDFLFLPGFTLKQTVTEISGRGFGLDVVQNMVRSVRGAIRLTNQPGRGLRLQLQLPLTLSVLRGLLVEIGGEPYAFPLSQISHTIKLSPGEVRLLEGRRLFHLGEQAVGLFRAHDLLGLRDTPPEPSDLRVIVLSGRGNRYGLVVDRFLGERELVVQPLDARLGKVQTISSAALMEDGTPVLIVDVEDMVRLIELRPAGAVVPPRPPSPAAAPKRVLAVDDSLAVRELQRKLLTGQGYAVDVAADGVEAWNALRTSDYALVITDVDMPRLDGIELARLIKQDARLRAVPVLVISYKDGQEDRLRGLQAGVDCYLAKGSISDDAFLRAVEAHIGPPDL